MEIMLKEFHKRKQIIESRAHLAKASENPNSQTKRLRVCSPSTINRNLSVHKSDAQKIEKQTDKKVENQTDKKNPVDKPEDDKSDSHSNASGSGSPSSPTEEERKIAERFRSFWSSSYDFSDDDDENEMEEEQTCINIEDIVVEEINKRRKEEEALYLSLKI